MTVQVAPTMLIDTHTHLYLDNFLPSKEDIVRKAFEAGVGKMIFPNVDLTTVEAMKQLHRAFPDSTFMAMGLHPTEIKENWQEALRDIKTEFDTNRNAYIAVGEVGMDLYWDKTFREEQMQAFEQQCVWAVESKLPVIIHCREALDETLEVLSGLEEMPSAVFHSFGGTPSDVDKIRRVGDFYFGINGVVTYKNSKLSPTLPCIGIDRILLETDSPYLTPVPFRGKRNDSSLITYVADKVAESLSLSREEIEEITTDNAIRLFAIH